MPARSLTGLTICIGPICVEILKLFNKTHDNDEHGAHTITSTGALGRGHLIEGGWGVPPVPVSLVWVGHGMRSPADVTGWGESNPPQ